MGKTRAEMFAQLGLPQIYTHEIYEYEGHVFEDVEIMEYNHVPLDGQPFIVTYTLEKDRVVMIYYFSMSPLLYANAKDFVYGIEYRFLAVLEQPAWVRNESEAPLKSYSNEETPLRWRIFEYAADENLFMQLVVLGLSNKTRDNFQILF